MKRRHVWWLLILLLLLAGAGGIVVWLQMPGSPDPYKQSGAEIINYLASVDFSAMSFDAKEQYFARLLESAEDDSFRRMIFSQGEAIDALDDASYDRLMDNAMLLGMKAMDEGRFGPGGRRPGPPAEDKEDERPTARWRSEAAQQTSEGSERPRGFRRRGQRGFTPRRLRYIIANTSPERRARFVERIKAFGRAFGRSGRGGRNRPG